MERLRAFPIVETESKTQGRIDVVCTENSEACPFFSKKWLKGAKCGEFGEDSGSPTKKGLDSLLNSLWIIIVAAGGRLKSRTKT